MPWLAAVGGALGTAASAVGTAAGAASTAIGSGLGAAGSALGSAGSAIGSGLGSAGTAVGQALGPAATGLADVGTNIAKGVGDFTGIGGESSGLQTAGKIKGMMPGAKPAAPGPQISPVNNTSQGEPNQSPQYSQLMDYLNKQRR